MHFEPYEDASQRNLPRFVISKSGWLMLVPRLMTSALPRKLSMKKCWRRSDSAVSPPAVRSASSEGIWFFTTTSTSWSVDLLLHVTRNFAQSLWYFCLHCCMVYRMFTTSWPLCLSFILCFAAVHLDNVFRVHSRWDITQYLCSPRFSGL